MKITKIAIIAMVLFMAGSLVFASGAKDKAAPAYPTRTIQMIVPATPGGATDGSARLFAREMTEVLGQTVVVVNQDGAGGQVAHENVRTARPDGYTILYTHTFLHTSHHSGKYEYSARDYEPIAPMSFVNLTFAIDSKSPWNTLDDFVQDARRNPGKYVVGVGLGGTTHFMAANLMIAADIDFRMVDAGQQVDRLAALKGGHLHMIVNAVGSSKDFVDAGEMKVLAVLSEERDSIIPEFPTALEQGYDVVLPVLHTLYAPKGTPENVIETLNDAVRKAYENPAFMERMHTMGQNFTYRTVDETRRAVAAEDERIKILAEALAF